MAPFSRNIVLPYTQILQMALVIVQACTRTVSLRAGKSFTESEPETTTKSNYEPSQRSGGKNWNQNGIAVVESFVEGLGNQACVMNSGSPPPCPDTMADDCIGIGMHLRFERQRAGPWCNSSGSAGFWLFWFRSKPLTAGVRAFHIPA